MVTKKDKEINDLIKSFPDELKKDINKIKLYYYDMGVKAAFSLVYEAISVPADDVENYSVTHIDEING